MTVLQQVRTYYMHLVPGNLTNDQLTKKLGKRLMTSQGVKAHPSPLDYFAERAADGVKATNRLLSEQV